MLAAAYTLQRNEHVRIDIVTQALSKRTRDWIDLFGHVFFLRPFVFLMAYLSWPFFMQSYLSRRDVEQRRRPDPVAGQGRLSSPASRSFARRPSRRSSSAFWC